MLEHNLFICSFCFEPSMYQNVPCSVVLTGINTGFLHISTKTVLQYSGQYQAYQIDEIVIITFLDNKIMLYNVLSFVINVIIKF